MTGSLITLSARLLLPFARVCGTDPHALRVLTAHGFSLASVANPDARIPHAQAMAMLEGLMKELADPALGLKAGDAVEQGDLDIFGELVSNQITLRAAVECTTRYYRLLHSGAEFSVVREGDTGVWRYRVQDGLEEPAAVHDFVVTSLSKYAYLCTRREQPKLAVHFAHGDRTNLAVYRRLFCCPVEFDMPYTGVVFPAERLDWPLTNPATLLSEAFEARAREAMANLGESRGLAGLVRETLLGSMESGDVSMPSVARRLGLSVATLRRKLASEDTTHSELLDQVRKELALQLLERDAMSAAKIALWLGFADTSAFHRAFRRWTGSTPSTYRQREKA